MAFPSSPTNGQTVVVNNVTYVYNSTLGVWDTQGSVSTASPVSSVAGRTGTVTLTAADIAAGTFPGALTAGSTLTVVGTTTLAAVSATTGTFSSTLSFPGGSGINSSGDFIARRSSGATGVYYFVTAGGVYLYYDGSAFNLNGGSIFNISCPTAVTGAITATGTVTAGYSDARLKTDIVKIENALDKIDQLAGVTFNPNDKALELGITDTSRQVGLIAGAVQVVQPEAVKPAPFDLAADGSSKSGENYLTVQYEKLVPLLVEAIKELRAEINTLKGTK
jgi:hypothetical protein